MENPPLVVTIHERNINKTVILALVIQVVGVGLGYLLQFLLARWMGGSEYGTYASTVAWATAIAALAAFGLPNSVLRFVPEYSALGDLGRLKGFIRSSYAVSLALGGAAGLLSGLLFVVLRHHAARSSLAILLFCSWLVPILTVSSVQSQLCRGFKWIAMALAWPMIVRPLSIVAVAFLFFHSRHALTSGTSVTILGTAVILIAIVQGLLFRWNLPRSLGAVPPQFDHKMWLSVSIPLWLISGFSIVLNQLDILMVSARLGVKAAGQYNVASCSSDMVVLGLIAVNAIAAPTYASLFAQGKRDEMQTFACRIAFWICWPAVAISTILACFAHAILASFGPEFAPASTAMIVLALGQLVNAGAGSVGYLLSMTGHQNESARVLAWTALVNISLNYVGITYFGLTGAAVATAFSMALWNIWLYQLVVRHLSVRPSILFAIASKLRPSEA